MMKYCSVLLTELYKDFTNWNATSETSGNIHHTGWDVRHIDRDSSFSVMHSTLTC
jgi:hypothetical protein